MKMIIDTHIYLWALSAPERIQEKKRQEIKFEQYDCREI